MTGYQGRAFVAADERVMFCELVSVGRSFAQPDAIPHGAHHTKAWHHDFREPLALQKVAFKNNALRESNILIDLIFRVFSR